MSFDAAQFDSTITFEKQGTAIAEPLPVSDEQGDAVDDDEPIDAAEIQDAAEDEPVEANSDEEQYAAAEQDDSTEVEQEEVSAVSETPETDESRPYSTQIFTMPTPSGSGATVADVAPTQDETVDSLMAQISSQASPRPQMNVPDPASAPSPAPSSSPLASVPDPSLPSMKQANVASRTSLFDLPAPSAQVLCYCPVSRTHIGTRCASYARCVGRAADRDHFGSRPGGTQVSQARPGWPVRS